MTVLQFVNTNVSADTVQLYNVSINCVFVCLVEIVGENTPTFVRLSESSCESNNDRLFTKLRVLPELAYNEFLLCCCMAKCSMG